MDLSLIRYCPPMDRLTPEQRSRLMSRIRSKDTGIELVTRSGLHRRGFRFRKHVSGLPGRPDIVFPTEKIAVFVDGDFWHGYRFPAWRHTLGEFWQQKIERNRVRGRRNFAKLRRAGWTVIRVWGHDLKRDPERAIDRVCARVLAARRVSPSATARP